MKTKNTLIRFSDQQFYDISEFITRIKYFTLIIDPSSSFFKQLNNELTDISTKCVGCIPYAYKGKGLGKIYIIFSKIKEHND